MPHTPNTGDPEHLDRSTVEDLDLEQGSDAPGDYQRSRLWEMVLGLLLLVGVLGYAGWQWWSTERNSSHYAQGREAAQERHWDEALSHFTEVRGYKDADALAANAQKQIEERDRQYAAAQTGVAAGASQAIEALSAARAVQTIEPGYRDVDALAARAEGLVYDDALSGAIVLRTGAEGTRTGTAELAGLYYRAEGNWHHLDGTDRYSQVLNFNRGADGCVVYDVPGPSWTAPLPSSTAPTPTADPNRVQIPGFTPKAGRLLMVGRLGDDGLLRSAPLTFDPAKYDFYFCARDSAAARVADTADITTGVTIWGLQMDASGLDMGFLSRNSLIRGSRVSYQRIEGGLASPVKEVIAPGLPGYSGIIELGESGGAIVSVAQAKTEPALQERALKEVFVAKADGSDPRAVFSTTGTLISVQLSPSERYLLVTAIEPVPEDIGPQGYHPVVMGRLFDLHTGAPPATVMETTAQMRVFRGDRASVNYESYVIGSTFLKHGELRDRLLIGDLNEGNLGARLLDPADPGVALAQATWKNTVSRRVLNVVERADGRTLLLYVVQRASSPQTAEGPGPEAVDAVAVHMPSGAGGGVETRALSLPLPDEFRSVSSAADLVYLGLAGDHLLYTAYTTGRSANSMNVYSAPWSKSAAQGTAGPPTPLVRVTWHHEALDTRAITSYPSTSSLAYIDEGGTLHAVSYSSGTDLALGGEITPLMALQPAYTVHYLR